MALKLGETIKMKMLLQIEKGDRGLRRRGRTCWPKLYEFENSVSFLVTVVLSNKELSGLVRAICMPEETQAFDCSLRFRTSEGGEVMWKGKPEPIRRSLDDILRSGNCLRIGEALWRPREKSIGNLNASGHGRSLLNQAVSLEISGTISARSPHHERKAQSARSQMSSSSSSEPEAARLRL